MKENMEMIFCGPIEKWDEAIALGNGKLGCLIWGKPHSLRFSLDRPDIWDRTVPCHTEDDDFTYQHLVKLAHEKNTDKIREIFDAPYQYPVPTKLPAGKLLFRAEGETKISSILHLDTAEAYITIGEGIHKMKIRTMCHAVTGTGMIRTEADASVLSVCLENPKFGASKQKTGTYDPEQRTISQGSLEQLQYPLPEKGQREEGEVKLRWFTQQVDQTFSYGIVLGEKMWEKGTDYFYRILSSKDGEDWLEEGIHLLVKQLNHGYEYWVDSHVEWWRNYWGKSEISLPDPWMQKQWYLANYLFASCSRKGGYPMSLQGVWTADDGNLPPWKGDYHNDLNTQLSYTHFFKADHLEEGEAFLDFLWDLKEEAGVFAKKFYGTEGICLPGVMTIDGKPLGGWPMYSLSPVQQIWLCKSFDDYYRYTADKEFLENRAWIYFKETAKCITALLMEVDGKYYLPVSSSPEIHDDETQAWVTANSNYDLALLRYLYETLCIYAKRLGKSEENYYEDILSKLPDFSVDDRKVLMISPDEILQESHRHLSNAMPICPLNQITYEKEEDKKIIDAVILDYERLGTGMWVGFSFAWMAHLYAIAENGEGAAEQLRIFWESFCSPNGFHLNGDYKKRGYTTFHYRPFTLEANMFAADGLQEMLMQMSNGKLKLFPAIPEKWKHGKVEFSGFRGERGIKVTAKTENMKMTYLEICSKEDQEILVKCLKSQTYTKVELKKGKNIVFPEDLI